MTDVSTKKQRFCEAVKRLKRVADGPGNGKIVVTLHPKLDTMTGKRIAWLLPLVALFLCCGGEPTARELVEIDSLLAAEKNDSAYQIISTYDAASFQNEAVRAVF